MVTFGGELRTEDVAHEAMLHVWVITEGCERAVYDHHSAVTGSHDWARHQVTAQVPVETVVIRFGVTLTGHGRAELRNVELTNAPS